MTELTTVTIGGEDDPTFSLCEGHVDQETFNKAFVEEGWSESDGFDQELLAHEYWIEKDDNWTKATKDTPGAKAVTVGTW
jgi:hypothetical protein